MGSKSNDIRKVANFFDGIFNGKILSYLKISQILREVPEVFRKILRETTKINWKGIRVKRFSVNSDTILEESHKYKYML